MLEKKTLIINFFGGSYGNFVETFLSGNLKEGNINLLENNFHKNTKKSLIFNMHKTHDNEKLSDEFNLKITYKEEHIDLISRNVWNKLPDHLKEKTNELFENYPSDIDDVTKKIITISFYKNKLLYRLKNWNKILKQTTLELPMHYFFTNIEDWLLNWKKLFKNLSCTATDQYIFDAYHIFHKTQRSLLDEHNFYKNLHWSKQDIIGKGNHLGELYFNRHSKNNVPIDIVKFKDTRHMLSEWTSNLDTTHAEL
jgi:hypothetical protein